MLGSVVKRDVGKGVVVVALSDGKGGKGWFGCCCWGGQSGFGGMVVGSREEVSIFGSWWMPARSLKSWSQCVDE